jgi:hypothetical protein
MAGFGRHRTNPSLTWDDDGKVWNNWGGELMRTMEKSLGILAGALLMGAGAFTPAMAQRVVNVSPEVNAQDIDPGASISGQFDTSTGTVAVDSVMVFVNDQDVTSLSTITGNFFTYRPTSPSPPARWRCGWNIWAVTAFDGFLPGSLRCRLPDQRWRSLT